MADIPDFTATELNAAEAATRQHYGRAADIELADTVLQLDPARPGRSSCPTLFWAHEGCTFVVFKTGESRYRCQFSYRPTEQHGTGVSEYEDLGECINALLRAQVEHAENAGG